MGTGDGTYAYRLARSQSVILVIGLDSNAENLREISHKAGLKESKGGLSNLLLGQLSLEQSPGELFSLADSISVLLPWGSLLKTVALPDLGLLDNLRKLGKPGATLTMIFGYSPAADPGQVKELGLPVLNTQFLQGHLKSSYQEAGFSVRVKEIPVEEIKKLPSRWAKKLAFSGKTRTFVKIQGHLTSI